VVVILKSLSGVCWRREGAARDTDARPTRAALSRGRHLPIAVPLFANSSHIGHLSLVNGLPGAPTVATNVEIATDGPARGGAVDQTDSWVLVYMPSGLDIANGVLYLQEKWTFIQSEYQCAWTISSAGRFSSIWLCDLSGILRLAKSIMR
jgi:hypothetical protein